MLSKSLIKLINSLKIKKYRQKHQLFVAEGQKLVADLLELKAGVRYIISSDLNYSNNNIEVIYCKQYELQKLSSLKHSSDIVAVVEIPKYEFSNKEISNNISIALDNIQDPGNMGTIIRVANWFGIRTILCSKTCVDIYNPKVVQATMGALMGVKVHYLDLYTTISDLKTDVDYKIFGTFMTGQNIYTTSLSNRGLIVMGSEGQGISEKLGELIDIKLSIPGNAQKFNGSESLNVGVATGIVVSEFTRCFTAKL